MTAIILTAQQAADLEAANASANPNRALKPRQLQDGRLILNADILDDPYFADPSRPWVSILAGEPIIVEEPQAGQPAEVAVEGEEAIVESLKHVRSGTVTLTAAELAQPEL